MIVCHCRGVSDREIVAAARRGAREIHQVQRACGAGTECAGCHERIGLLLEAVVNVEPALRAS